MKKNHDIFENFRRENVRLRPEEKEHIWQVIQLRMRTDMEVSPDTVAHISEEDNAMASAFFLPASSVHLSVDEHVLVQEGLGADSLLSPLRRVTLGELERASVLSGIFGNTHFVKNDKMPAQQNSVGVLRWLLPACSMLVLATVGSVGISYAAENALPGEFLYSVKRASEQLGANFHFGIEAKAEAETQRMERRIREAQALHEAERLTDTVSESLDQQFRLQRREVNQRIAELDESGKTEAAAKLRARLNATEDAYKRYFRRVEAAQEQVVPAALAEEQERKPVSGRKESVSSVAASAGTTTSASVRTRTDTRVVSTEQQVEASASVQVEQHVESHMETGDTSEKDSAEQDAQTQQAIDAAKQIEENAWQDADRVQSDIEAQMRAQWEITP